MRHILCLAMLPLAAVVAGADCQGTSVPAPLFTPQALIGDPVIKSVEVLDSEDHLVLTGVFGEYTGIVRVSGMQLNVDSWATIPSGLQQIICVLPRELHGNVQVEVDARVSNIVQLTKWDLNFVSRTITAASPFQSGQNLVEINVKLILRACLNNLRDSTAPSFDVPASVSRASTASVSASGTLVSPPPPGFYHSSTTLLAVTPQDFKIRYPGDPVDPYGEKFTIDGFVCGATRGIGGGLKVRFNLAAVCKVFQRMNADVSVSERPVGFGSSTYFDLSIPVDFTFDSDFNIASDSTPARTNSNSTLIWQQAPALSPPLD